MRETYIQVWCVKYALTQGIFPVVGCETEGGRFTVPKQYYQSLGKNDWTRTLASAKEAAEEKRLKKIVSLRKQLEKLETYKAPVKGGG